MNIETFRKYCLSFPDTHEGMPFQGFFKNSRAILVFYAGKKMFCFIDIDRFDYCTIKCNPATIIELQEKEGFEKPFNLSWKHWINISLDGTISDEMLKEFVKKSYQLAAKGATNKINE